MELKNSTWLDKDELISISENLRLLGYSDLSEQLKEHIDTNEKSRVYGNYIMNLHGVDKKKLIEISKNYNII